MIRTLRRLVALVVAGAMLAAGLLAVLTALRGGGPPPWAPLDLSDPIGAASGRRLTLLADDPTQCHALLGRAGVRFTAQPPRRGAACGLADALRLDPGGSRRIAFRPARPLLSCPMAAGLAALEWSVIQPAAWRRFGATVVAIDQAGSYACRRLYGRTTGRWSEHATANALDVTGFLLSDGRRVGVAVDWRGTGSAALFLHDVRDGACGLFATVLSPDYNAAHRDHLHLDQARRGGLGWRACR